MSRGLNLMSGVGDLRVFSTAKIVLDNGLLGGQPSTTSSYICVALPLTDSGMCIIYQVCKYGVNDYPNWCARPGILWPDSSVSPPFHLLEHRLSRSSIVHIAMLLLLLCALEPLVLSPQRL